MNRPVLVAVATSILLVGCGAGIQREPEPASTGSVTIPEATIEPAPSPSDVASPGPESPVTEPAS